MTLRALVILSLTACGTKEVHVDPCSEAKPESRGFAYGVAHVAGMYPQVSQGDSFLLRGAERVRDFGVKTLKVYLTPNFREKYDEEWPLDVRSVGALADTAQYKKLFAMPFDTFVITTYTFANGNDGGFIDGASQGELDAEYKEVRQLAEYLLRTYAGTGKRFILQNWESDWAVRPNAERVAPELTKWIKARQQAVSDARAAVGASNVSVVHAFEVNVVLDDLGAVKMVDAVLPNVCVDAVSYSSWESVIPMHSTTESVDNAVTKLSRAVSYIQSKLAKPSLFYLGEIGFAEQEMDEPRDVRISSLLDELEEKAPTLGIESAIYWQIFDNECSDHGCRGFWLVRPDGALSAAGKAFTRMAAR